MHRTITIMQTGTRYKSRVEKLLAQAVDNPAVLLCAGAGYGKSQAVRSLLHNGEAKAVWVRLGRMDSKTAYFWRNFTGALAEWNGAFSQLLGTWDFPETAPAFHYFLRRFSHRVYQEERLLLVFDGVHQLHGAGPVYTFVKSLANAGIENTTVVLLSQGDEDEEAAKWLGKSMVWLTAKQLRFTPEEIKDYFAAENIALTHQEAHRVCRFTDGRAFAVFLLTRYLKKGKALTSALALAPAKPLEFLLEQEIYAACSPAIKRTLVRLSLLDSFPLALAQELSGSSRDIQLLAESRLLVDYNPQQGCYFFQRVFQKFLQDKQHVLTPEETAALFHRAALWHEARGNLLEAIFYYSSAGDYEKMLVYVHRYGYLPVSRSKARECLAALELFPGAYSRTYPILRIVKASMLYNNLELDAATRELEEVKAELEADASAQNKSLLGEVYAILAYVSLGRCSYDFVDLFQRAAELLPQGSTLINRRSQFVGNRNMFTLAGREAGHLERMVESLIQAIPFSRRVLGSYGSGWISLAQAEAAYYTGKLDSAGRYAHQAIQKGLDKEQWDIVCNGYFLLMRVGFCQGSYSAVEDYLLKLQEYGDSACYSSFFAVPETASSWFHLKMGRTDKVAGWILSDAVEDFLTPMDEGRNQVIRSGYLLMERRFDELWPLLEAGIRQSTARGQVFILIKLLSVKAIALELNQCREQAVAALREACDWACANGIIMPFIEIGGLMQWLLQRLRQELRPWVREEWMDSIAVQAGLYGQRLDRLRREYGERSKGWSSPLARLSVPERELLRGLCSGQSREVLAARLSLSKEELRRALGQMYTKLGAVNRSDAVLTAMLHSQGNG